MNGYSSWAAIKAQSFLAARTGWDSLGTKWAALSLSSCTPTGSGWNEVTGLGYARAPVRSVGVGSQENWHSPDFTHFWPVNDIDYTAYNKLDISFPVAGAPWGTVVAFGLFTEKTGGNLIYGCDLDEPVIILAAVQPKIKRKPACPGCYGFAGVRFKTSEY